MVARVRTYLSLGLAASLAIPISFAQSTTDVRNLQEENAALRRRLAELEGRGAAPAPAAQPVSAAPAVMAPAPSGTTTSSSNGEITVLSPFQVSTDQDYGYLKTNSVTATRIGTEIQKTPLGISIMSSDFLADTNMQNVTDLLRYTATGSGD